MTKKLSYIVEYFSSHGDFREEQMEVGYENVNQFRDDALDEMARRHIISDILENGGRTTKITRLENWEESIGPS